MATLRNDGTIQCFVNGRWQRAKNEPIRAKTIALGAGGLWCLDSKGKIYRWNLDLENSAWHLDDSVQNVESICITSSGKLCAVNKNGEVLTRHQRSPKVDDGEKNINNNLWQSANQDSWFTDTNNRIKRRIRRLRFLLSSTLLLCLVLTYAYLLLKSQRQQLAIEVFEAHGATVRYAHEIDDQGKPILSPTEPGYEWLKKLVGRHAFIRPIQLETNSNSGFDLNRIADLKSLKRLKLSANNMKNFDKIGELKNLEVLNIAQHENCDLSPLAGAKELRELTIDTSSSYEVTTDLRFVASLRKLKSITLRTRDSLELSPLANLDQLESVELSYAESLEPLYGLPQLKRLVLSVEIRPAGTMDPDTHDPTYKQSVLNLAGIESLTQLEELQLPGFQIEDMRPIRGLTALKSLTAGGAPGDLSPLSELNKLTKLNLANYPSSRREGKSNLSDLKNLVDLEELNLLSRNLSDLSELAPFKKLKKLSMSGLTITDLVKIQSLTTLEVLEIPWSAITDLKPLTELEQLRELTLGGPGIVDLNPLAGLTKLEVLNFERTEKLSDLSPLGSLTQLRKIRIPHKRSRYASQNPSWEMLLPVLDLPNLQIVWIGTETQNLRHLQDYKRLKEFKAARQKFDEQRAKENKSNNYSQ